MHAFGILGRPRIPRGEMLLHTVDERRIRLERRIHRGNVAVPESPLHFVRHVIAPAAVLAKARECLQQGMAVTT